MRLLQIFEEIVEEKQLEEEAKLEIYKQIELERIPDAIAHVDWNDTAVDVAGQLVSTLILKYALPNANHRTSIGIAQWYLENIETGFSFPDFATEAYDWVGQRIHYRIEATSHGETEHDCVLVTF